MSWFYRTDNQQERVTVSMAPDAAFRASLEALEQIGTVKEQQEQFRRVVGTTRMRGLAYTTLTVVVEPSDQSASAVLSVSASAPDGMPKRGYATKGISRFLEAFPTT
jgi:hypothetical protein